MSPLNCTEPLCRKYSRCRRHRRNPTELSSGLHLPAAPTLPYRCRCRPTMPINEIPYFYSCRPSAPVMRLLIIRFNDEERTRRRHIVATALSAAATLTAHALVSSASSQPTTRRTYRLHNGCSSSPSPAGIHYSSSSRAGNDNKSLSHLEY